MNDVSSKEASRVLGLHPNTLRDYADDLDRTVQFMQSRYPEAKIIKDIGSGVNSKRKGLKSLLGRAMRTDKLKIVVAHKDRLVHFGFKL